MMEEYCTSFKIYANICVLKELETKLDSFVRDIYKNMINFIVVLSLWIYEK